MVDRSNFVAAPAMLCTARYQIFSVFFSTRNRRFPKTFTFAMAVDATPVIETSAHVVPLYNFPLSTPFTAHRNDPPGVTMFVYCHWALVRPVTTAAPTGPVAVAS